MENRSLAMSNKYPMVPLSNRYYLCGVTLWTRDLFQRIGYLRPLEYDKSFWTKFLYHLWTLIFISPHLISLIFVEVAACFMFWPDLPRVFSASFILCANITHVIKLYSLTKNRDTFISLIDFFVQSLLKRDLKDPHVREIIIRHEKMVFRDIVATLSLTTVAVLGLSGIGDLMDPTGLPLVAWYPFEVTTPKFRYYLVYAHQMVAVLVAASINVTLDMFINNMVIQFCCQFQLLKRDIQLIQEIPVECHEEIAKRFHEVIDLQCILREKSRELSRACGVSVLGQFMGSILIICISFYQFVRASQTSILSILAIFSMVLWALLQAFFYCYYGNEIKIESQSVAQKLMELQWYRYSLSNKKTFLQMIRMAQRPIILHAAGVINITLEALMSIIKTAYSFFSVMASVERK